MTELSPQEIRFANAIDKVLAQRNDAIQKRYVEIQKQLYWMQSAITSLSLAVAITTDGKKVTAVQRLLTDCQNQLAKIDDLCDVEGDATEHLPEGWEWAE